jgi:hypothetical protein
LGKPYGINLRCYWEHLGERFVNLMVSPWDQGIFFNGRGKNYGTIWCVEHINMSILSNSL